jgi:DNA-binding NarL/FixJ family response regulator
MVRIVIADDHSMFRDGLKALLASEPGFQVIGEAGNLADAVRMVLFKKPDILLLDVSLPDGSGLDVVEQISTQAPGVRTLVLTANIDRAAVLRAIRAGARGVLLKHHATPMLFTSIRCIMEGQHWLDRANLSMVIEGMRRSPEIAMPPPATGNVFGLTKRELEVVGGVVAGESNREIATRLSIREDTVKHHLSHIFDKVGVFSRLELAVFAMNHRLVHDAVPAVPVGPAGPAGVPVAAMHRG